MQNCVQVDYKLLQKMTVDQRDFTYVPQFDMLEDVKNSIINTDTFNKPIAPSFIFSALGNLNSYAIFLTYFVIMRFMYFNGIILQKVVL